MIKRFFEDLNWLVVEVDLILCCCWVSERKESDGIQMIVIGRKRKRIEFFDEHKETFLDRALSSKEKSERDISTPSLN